MKKSEIVLDIFGKWHPSKSEKQILYELTRVLTAGHEDPQEWNATLSAGIVNVILRNLRSTRRSLTMYDIVRDIDIIVARSLVNAVLPTEARQG
jgi:hypothetical protein